MGGLAAAEAIIVIPEHVTHVAAGHPVRVIDLRQR
jgi:molybdopterin biosynthesis enzyme